MNVLLVGSGYCESFVPENDLLLKTGFLNMELHIQAHASAAPHPARVESGVDAPSSQLLWLWIYLKSQIMKKCVKWKYGCK